MNFFNTTINKKAELLLSNTLRSTFISEGSKVREFEQTLSEKFKFPTPVALNSGTSALHLALVIAGVKYGDEVILPAQTFIATGMAILMQGAIPVFADIQYETGNIDPTSIRSKITNKTKAIIPVHWAGTPCDMDEILTIAQEHNLVVIEDSAHALGAIYKNKPIGTLSRFTAFSFQAIKHLTTGDGGALVCKNPQDEEQARIQRWFSINRKNAKESILGEREYDATTIGYKYHMNDLSASIGLGNLESIENVLNRHSEIAKLYTSKLSNIDGLSFTPKFSDRKSSWWFFQLHVQQRNNFVKAMKSRNIPVSVVHQRIDKNSIFGGIRDDLVNQNKFTEDQIALPIHSNLTDKDINKIISAIKFGW